MQKKYNYVVHIMVEATCVSPIRMGNSENDTETVLKDVNGVPFIAGTSLAGVFRTYFEEINKADVLLGTQNREGNLVVSDGIFFKYKEVLRPRIRMQSETGTVAQGAKFDIAHLETGAKFKFSLTWIGMKEQAGDVDAIYEMLSKLHGGMLQIGAQKTNGFGKVLLKGKQQIYDLKKEVDRNHWLDGTGQYTAVKLPSVKESDYVVFKIKGKTQNILVKGEIKNTEKNTEYVENMKEQNEAIIPASSIKGAIRTRMIEIAKLRNMEVETSIFGGEENAGTVFFEDVILKQEKKKKISRIHINKFTGGVIEGELFSEEPIAAELTFMIKAVNDEVTCGLLLFALRDLAMGMFTIGSGKTIGRGQIQISEIQIMAPMNQKACMKVDGSRQITLEDQEELVKTWLKKLEAEHEN